MSLPSSSQAVPRSPRPPSAVLASPIDDPAVSQVQVQANVQEDASRTNTRPFEPFFVVIEELTSNTIEHPHVHYIFEDDDTQGVIDAARDSLEQHINQAAGQPTQEVRNIIVNLNDSGTAVQSAHSLNPGWHVKSSAVSRAPTLSQDVEGELGNATGGLMLRLAGSEPPQVLPEAGSLGMQTLIDAYQARMEEIKQVMNGLAGSSSRGE